MKKIPGPSRSRATGSRSSVNKSIIAHEKRKLLRIYREVMAEIEAKEAQ